MVGIYGEEMKDYIFQSAFEFDQKEILHYKIYDFEGRKMNNQVSHSNINVEDRVLNTFI